MSAAARAWFGREVLGDGSMPGPGCAHPREQEKAKERQGAQDAHNQPDNDARRPGVPPSIPVFADGPNQDDKSDTHAEEPALEGAWCACSGMNSPELHGAYEEHVERQQCPSCQNG